MSNFTTTSARQSGPFAEVEQDWLDWACVFADPLVFTHVSDTVRARAAQRATDRSTYYTWLTLAGRCR